MSIKQLYLSDNYFVYVSDDGTVYNSKMKPFKIQIDKNNYCSIGFHNKKLNGRFLIHRLVAKAFLNENLDTTNIVHHIDKDRTNNAVSNLLIIDSKSHHILHQQKYPLTKICDVCGKRFMPKPTKRKRSKVCSNECKLKLDMANREKQKRPILQLSLDREFIKEWGSLSDIKNTLGYNISNICKCCKHQIKRCYGYVWEYKNE